MSLTNMIFSVFVMVVMWVKSWSRFHKVA